MLTPMMAAYILHKPKKEHRQPRWLTIYSAGRSGA